MHSYQIPAARLRLKTEIDKSRFITTVDHTPDIDAAKRFIDSVRAECADASHHCWAYNAGPAGNSDGGSGLVRVGMSDDGEPRGTAGRPMLNVLLHGSVGEITIVVTRYFGGVKLGKGGLMRAYGGCAQSALQQLAVVALVPSQRLKVTVAYPSLALLQRLADKLGVTVCGQHFTEQVQLDLDVPLAELDEFEQALAAVDGAVRVT